MPRPGCATTRSLCDSVPNGLLLSPRRERVAGLADGVGGLGDLDVAVGAATGAGGRNEAGAVVLQPVVADAHMMRLRTHAQARQPVPRGVIAGHVHVVG